MKTRGNNDCSVVVLVREYIEGLKARRYSPRSLDTYQRALKDFIQTVGKADMLKITARDIEKYRGSLLERNFKPASVLVYLRAVRTFFRQLEESQRIFVNPAAGLTPMRIGRELQPVPTEDEMRILLSGPDVSSPTGIRDRALLETLYSTAARRAELVAMTVRCLNLEEGRVRIMGKGQRERMAPLGEEAVNWVGLYLKEVRPMLAGTSDTDALWLGMRGEPLTYHAPAQILRHYISAPGITTRIGMHSIRRACASHMLRRGASPATIQLLLGHATMRNLGQYLGVTIADLKQAHEESRLGQ